MMDMGRDALGVEERLRQADLMDNAQLSQLFLTCPRPGYAA